MGLKPLSHPHWICLGNPKHLYTSTAAHFIPKRATVRQQHHFVWQNYCLSFSKLLSIDGQYLLFSKKEIMEEEAN